MRPHRIAPRLVVVGLLALALGGCAITDAIFEQLGFQKPPDKVFLSVRDTPIVLTPGVCTTFLNPTPSDFPTPGTPEPWSLDDAFSFSLDQPSWLSVVTTRGADTRRQLCATDDAPAVSNLAVSYTYIRHGTALPANELVTKVFSGRLLISTVTQDLAVHPTADPPGISSFGQSTLSANISGGAPPYTVLWTPAGTITNATAPSTLVSPDDTTTYTVRVTDATGVTVTGTVIVSVGPFVRIDADPPRNAGWDPGV